MAKPPMAMGDEAAEPAPDQGGDTVLATITQAADGSYGLQAGDEAGPDAGEPQRFTSVGELMGAVLDLVQGSKPGEQEQAMTAAFNG